MPIIPQNNSLLSNAAASILGGKQIVSLDNTDDIRATAVAFIDVIAPFCGDASSKEIEKAITTSDKTIKTVFVNGVTFEFDKKTFAVYIVNSYDLSQLQNFYGDVNGAELPSGYFVVVVPVKQIKADDWVGNTGMVAAPEVLNVETGKAIKESADSTDLNSALVTLKAALKYGQNLEGKSSVEAGDLQHFKSLISKGLSQLSSNGKVQKYKLGAISSGLSHTAVQNDLGDILNYIEGAILTIADAAGIKESGIAERTTSVTYAQAISALGGSAEDEDISVLKRYADCVAIIFKMTSREVMRDLLPEDDTYKAKDVGSDKITKKIEIDAEEFKAMAPKAYAKLKLTDKSIVRLEYFDHRSKSMGVELVRVRVGNTFTFINALTGMDPMEYKNVEQWIHEEL
jgi:hypothetical protein